MGPEEPTHAPSLRILVAEDDESIAYLIERIVARGGGACRTVRTGGEALVAVHQGPWTALVADLLLPDMAGLELIGEIRRGHPDLPIVAMSATFGGEVAQRARHSGADDFITKPFVPSTFWSQIERLVDGRPSAGHPGTS